MTTSSLAFTLIIQCFIVLKLIVFKGNIRTKSEPVVRLCFFPDNMILNFFRVKFIEKLSNGLIDIHLIVPPNSETKKSKSYFLEKRKKLNDGSGFCPNVTVTSIANMYYVFADKL